MSRIVYAFKDIDDNLFTLNADSNTDVFSKSLTYGDEALNNDNRIAEKSSLAGSVKLGKTRTKARDVTLTYSRIANGIEASVFTSAENEFIYQFNKAVYLVDVTNNRQVKVAPEQHSFTYAIGGHKLIGDGSISFIMLEPFWTSLTVTTYNLSLAIGDNLLVLDNDGFINTPPTLTFTASAAVSVIKAYIDETKQGIRIDDTVFGDPGFGTMIVNCETGEISINQVNRNISIVDNTGFFEVPVGESDLIVNVNAVCDIQVDFYEREYI